MQPSLNWLEDPGVFRVNRLNAHSDHHWYQTPGQQAAGEEPFRQSLNGEWLFAWSPAPAAPAVPTARPPPPGPSRPPIPASPP